MKDINAIISKMTLEEKARLCSGASEFTTEEIERLEIPAITMSDGPHGLRKEKADGDGGIPAVSFPAECAMASSFDRELVREIGRALGAQWQAADSQIILGPGVNIKRSPLCGRNFEYFSEDPLLSGEMGTAYVQGVQSQGVGTCVKHFLANSQESFRKTSSSEVDERTLREIYMPAFERVVKQAKPWSVMSSYNKINGTFATENREFLTDVLRKEWGFDGCVISDWCATHNRAAAVAAGTDLTMPGERQTDEKIVQAVQAGFMPEVLVDEACRNILQLVFRAAENRKGGAIDYEQGHEVCRKAAAESAVLLKNEGNLLPLCPEQKILFVGEFAAAPRYQGGGSSHVNTMNVTSAMKAVNRIPGVQVKFCQGCEGEHSDARLLEEAISGAQKADVVVVFAGLCASAETEGIDRRTMAMPESHNTLIRAVAAVQPNTVVVLHNGSPVEMPWVDDVKATLELYLGGEAVGEATVDLLFGRTNPSGRLAETFPKRLEDNPSYLFYIGTSNAVEYREGIYVGYRYYESKKMDVLFPFGHGLSYTDFQYSNLRVDRDIMHAEDTLKVAVDVTNAGDCFGKEVVQLYVAAEQCAILRPVKELRGFEKVALEPGETKTVEFTLSKRVFPIGIRKFTVSICPVDSMRSSLAGLLMMWHSVFRFLQRKNVCRNGSCMIK